MNLCYNDGHESLRDAVREFAREVSPGWKAAP